MLAIETLSNSIMSVFLMLLISSATAGFTPITGYTVYQYEDVALNSQAVPEPVVNEVQVITTSTGAATLLPETQRIVISGVDQTVLINNQVSFRFKALGNRYFQQSFFLNIIS
jgi:hypothetical protein